MTLIIILYHFSSYSSLYLLLMSFISNNNPTKRFKLKRFGVSLLRERKKMVQEKTDPKGKVLIFILYIY